MRTVAVTETRLFEVPDELVGHFKEIALAEPERLKSEWIAVSLHRSAHLCEDETENE